MSGYGRPVGVSLPWIDPHTVNDKRINYSPGSRQAELATVDGAEMGGAAESQAGLFHNPVRVLMDRLQSTTGQRGRRQMIYAENKYVPLD